MTAKLIYRFAPGSADGDAGQKALLGGKGANLAEMANLGVPVPPGFTITTELCVEYFRAGGKLPSGLRSAVEENLAWLEAQTGKRFGGASQPLLVSVRSGARSSMPGMMDTILNLGLNDETVAALREQTKNPRFALDAYRRFLTMYGDVVLGVERTRFDGPMNEARRRAGAALGIPAPVDVDLLVKAIPDSMLRAEELEQVVTDFKAILVEHAGGFPSRPIEQLMGAIAAVFESWRNPRASFYRRMNGIPDEWGTAVNVQAMVFGNLGDTSATGVAFTRDPSTGERRFFGEWLPNAQGEDVVAGLRTPQHLAKATGDTGSSLEEANPAIYRQLYETQQKLERHFRDMQDLEFTVEDGQLFLLQTRNGKRSARAEVRIAVEMVREGLITRDEALLRVSADRVEELLFPSIDPKAGVVPATRGLPASPGAVTGYVSFSADDAERRAEAGEPVILVRIETSPEDLHGMKAARGILTARGGATSHAAVVARGMGRACVVGCSAISIDRELGILTIRDSDEAGAALIVNPTDLITIDGSSGAVYLGDVAKTEPELGGEFAELLGWADAKRRLRVRANADTPHDAKQARSLGAEGIGLCRTEHMFFDEERIEAVREMILAGDLEAREAALAKLLPFQTGDFVEIFRAMGGLPVTIRLLDPPLHEFLPALPEQMAGVARSLGVEVEAVARQVERLHEVNPMLGHRGCRLGVTFPEISAMQVRAILTAACTVAKEGVEVHPELMIPLAFGRPELDLMKTITEQVAEQVFSQAGIRVAYEFGTMIELPRAAVLADDLARTAEFFSFGTNDLTQTALGLSRDDAGKFLPEYVRRGILPRDPFVSLDQEGVGALVRMAVEKGRATRPDISLGICGEHGGDPASIDFFHRAGLAYVSCSPFRAPIARLAAAQAALRSPAGAG
ncbi:MAG: pyruvate, phosphate dikinase [Sorangiineae bacterium]|nr:pyruvate, phosphate dikinase [Polyangiaceae bacterium]MEB2323895.1 pyruvate, phosphate dikinase [Sorangiineae bacterium]